MASPLVILVSCAVFAGSMGSLFTIIALSVDYWQYVSFDPDVLRPYSVVNFSSEYFVTMAVSEWDYVLLEKTNTQTSANGTPQVTNYYLYKTISGVWRMCNHLSASSLSVVSTALGEPVNSCYTFVTEYDEENRVLPDWMKSIGGMHNSAASCFIVSLIDLSAAVAVGTFAIIQKQVSACMVTGVLYCMAGLFSVFGLTIFHTKMYYETYQCYSFDREKLPGLACDARQVEIGWAIPMLWVGVVMCVIAFGLWIFVTRAFRVIKSKTMI